MSSPFSSSSLTLSFESRRIPLYALIIGINQYASSEVKNLRGGVTDAMNFKEYLQEDLKVPPNQILLLLDKDATREAIIENFKFLRDDNRIQHGDAIFIFYAGHGTQVERSKATRMELLVPHDFSMASPKKVPGIPDRHLAKLINEIEQKKGNNITVVLDCCHSASITRDSQSQTSVRSVGDLLNSSYYELHAKSFSDEEAMSTRSLSTDPGASVTSLQSHILVAACSSTELARESNERGLFSSAFLALLRTQGLDQLRYSDILKYIDTIPSQNPQCRGDNANRFIFNKKILPPQRKFFPIKFDPEKATFILQAGTAHGVNKQDEFTVYSSTYLSGDEHSLGCLTVTEARPYVSIMNNVSRILLPTPGVAVKSKSAGRPDLRLYIGGEARDDISSWITTLLLKHELGNIKIVDKEVDAHISLYGNNQEVQFRVVEMAAPEFESVNKVQDPKGREEDIVHILKASANFFWQRHRRSMEMTKHIKVEFYRLEEAEDEFIPIGENLCVDNKIEFVVEDNVPYGIRCTNRSKSTDFFPSLFYFDSSDLSIAPYYMHPPPAGEHAVEPPLPKDGGILIIGPGSNAGADRPFTYYLRPGQDIDVGHIKIFLFTHAIDQEDVPQLSPFEETRAMAPFVAKSLGDIWGSITIPVIQRRRL